ncbi:hypothetical protein BV25DRAFT_1843420 [Artomyces pyxidatus]|uniref:Uncharacterized protein n=2 Tax=Artomyces pyxidatus TaxID=48021 RepID=A0ACB8SG92_9AGAM|nr:hypothetical protein BV25DRAFT_1843473 [Artomyces pyxidatus]KAI0054781.1 hypothetical protein BV25DRAFT_1843420 [Artomyces pyxidatus]
MALSRRDRNPARMSAHTLDRQQEEQYLHSIRITSNAVMHYDPVNRALVVWYWPVDGDGRRSERNKVDTLANMSLLVLKGGAGLTVSPVVIERIYNMPGVPVKRYRLRRGGTTPPTPTSVTSAGIILLESHNPRPRRAPTTVGLLLQLDSHRVPGLSRREVQDLLVSCSGCGIIMTRRAVASFHTCAGAVEEDDGETGIESDSEL